MCPICLTIDDQKELSNTEIKTIASEQWDKSVFIVDEELNSPINQHVQQLQDRHNSNIIRKLTQTKQAQVMKKRRNAEDQISVGDLIALNFDQRDRSTWRHSNVLGIVIETGKSGGLGIQVATQNGVIYKNLHLSEPVIAYIPPDNYRKINQKMPINHDFEVIRKEINNGTYNKESSIRISMKQAHDMVSGHGNKCTCKNELCNVNCGCKKRGLSCTTYCGCGGRCKSQKSPKKMNIKQQSCRCKDTANCSMRCGCRKKNSVCNSSCKCRGLCSNKSSIMADLAMCKPCGTDGKSSSNSISGSTGSMPSDDIQEGNPEESQINLEVLSATYSDMSYSMANSDESDGEQRFFSMIKRVRSPKIKKEPIRPGDVIEYYCPMYVWGK